MPTMPTGPATGGFGEVRDELRHAAQDERGRLDRPREPDDDRFDRAVRDVLLRQLEDADAEGALLLDLVRGPQRRLDVLHRAVGVADRRARPSGPAGRRGTGAAAGGPRLRLRRTPSNTGKRCPSTAEDDVADRVVVFDARAWHVPDVTADESRRGRRRVRRHGPDADVHDRVGEQGDAREDDPREQEVDRDAGEEDAEARAEPLVDEGARIDRFAVLPFEPHEAADRQPVERVDRLGAAMEDRARAAGSRCRTRGP